jgi:hypothetical protein
MSDFRIAALALVFEASDAAHVRRGKSGKFMKPTGFTTSSSNDSQINMNSAAAAGNPISLSTGQYDEDASMQDIIVTTAASIDMDSIGQTESTMPGLTQFSLDEAVVIVTLPTTTSLPSVSKQSVENL